MLVSHSHKIVHTRMTRVPLALIHRRNRLTHLSTHLIGLSFVPELEFPLDCLTGPAVNVRQITLITSAL